MHDLSRHIRQPEIPPVIPIRQLLMIQPQQMQNRRVQIVDAHAINRRFVADFIGFAVADMLRATSSPDQQFITM